MMENKIKEIAKLIPAEVRAEVLAKLQKCTSVEAIKALVKEYDLPITDEMVEESMAYLGANQVLNDEDLEAVSGGSMIVISVITASKC